MKLEARHRLQATAEYRYGLVNRPPAIGAVPDGYIKHEDTELPRVRHGVLVYPRKLSDSDVKRYELVPLSDEYGKDLVLPHVPDDVMKPAVEGAETLKYLVDNDVDVSEPDIAEAVAEAKAKVDRLKAWCRAHGYKPDAAVSELDLPKTMILSYHIASPGSNVLPPADHMLRKIEQWVHGAASDLGADVKVGYYSYIDINEYVIFNSTLDEVLGRVTFEQGDIPRSYTPHATLAPSLRGKGVTQFIYRLVLDRGWALSTESHTPMARKVWDALGRKGYHLYHSDAQGNVLPEETATSYLVLQKKRPRKLGASVYDGLQSGNEVKYSVNGVEKTHTLDYGVRGKNIPVKVTVEGDNIKVSIK